MFTWFHMNLSLLFAYIFQTKLKSLFLSSYSKKLYYHNFSITVRNIYSTTGWDQHQGDHIQHTYSIGHRHHATVIYIERQIFEY